MDSKRITTDEYLQSLEKLYTLQFKDRKYDLIIAIDRFAYDFLLKSYEKFFTNEPILAVGIENFSEEKAKKYKVENRVSALLEKRDLKANVEAIKTLMPTLKKLYIINDKSINALHTEPLIDKLLKNHKDNFQLIYLKEDDLISLKNRFNKKEENSAALFIRFYKNKDGYLNKNSEISDFIKNSQVPIFITDSVFLGKGATGGKIVDLKDFGKKSAHMILEILDKKEHKIEIYKDLYYVFDAKKLEEFILPVDALSDDYKIVNKRLTFYDKNRGFIEVVFMISPLLIILIIGLLHNIYMRKETEKSLRQRIYFDKVLLDAIESPIFWEDENSIIVDSNSKFCNLLGIDCKEIYGKKLSDFSHIKNVSYILEILEKFKNEGLENSEFKFFDKSEKRVFLLKQEKFSDLKSKKSGLVTIFTDVTKQREIAKEKQRDRQFIIQQSKLAEIGEVFSSIAHQWKSPLVEITAIAQELFYTKKCKDIKEDESFVSDIMRQVNYMTDTINDFQKFIMPSNKKVEFDVYESIKSMLKIVEHNMKYNNIKIKIDVQENVCLLIYGYKNEFMQSFLNILNNAKDALLKNDYKNREILITITNEESDLIITIEDNAGGILSENIDDIFKPYYSTKKDGHGIGLYMCKMIIEDKMDGKLEVKNSDIGACFTIRLGFTCENISS